MKYDVAIIGAGIVGLASGLALSERYPRAKLLILEKEADVAAHQTGHNSGVIHSGIYYRPGSLKARFAREGNRMLTEWCHTRGIPYETCGKVIVATEAQDVPRLEHLYQRGLANNLEVAKLSAEQVAEIEPHCMSVAGLRVPSTGIVNYGRVARAFAQAIQERGGELRLNTKVQQIAKDRSALRIESSSTSFTTHFLINCAGLQCDRIAALMNVRTGMQIVPIRGEYYLVSPQKESLVKHLIYPVPNPHYPFLGVHFTRMIGGGLHAGPNAVLSLKREGYSKSAFNLQDSIDLASSRAFWTFASQNWREGMREGLRSVSKRLFVRSLQQLVPEIGMNDLMRPHAGVRAQALSRDGRLVDDFLLVPGPRSLHVCNAPSPAATASMPIGHAIVDHVQMQTQLPC